MDGPTPCDGRWTIDTHGKDTWSTDAALVPFDGRQRPRAAASVATGFPAIVPSSVFGATSPGNRINVGAIGVGRISRGHDMPDSASTTRADRGRRAISTQTRVEDGKKLVNDFYAKQDRQAVRRRHQHTPTTANCSPTRTSTPSSSARRITGTRSSRFAAVERGKDVYLQKPASLTIAEGRAVSNAVHRSGRIFQIGSQQRSTTQFRYAARAGAQRTDRAAQDRGGGTARRSVRRGRTPDAGAEDLNYEAWLGSTPYVFYTEKRVHPQVGYDRPGWLRCEQFGAGMITGWGAHHVDSAHWGDEH